jgi:hypothetical protein
MLSRARGRKREPVVAGHGGTRRRGNNGVAAAGGPPRPYECTTSLDSLEELYHLPVYTDP